MKKEIHPTVVIAILATFALFLGGYIFFTQSNSSAGAPAGRVIGGKHFPTLGGMKDSAPK
jgi:hypothetical protein